ncbi:hypothetical protein SELMODRAFT_417622 [Selaginella moellendorffii]|uniref:Pentacotripeptide-repeat region of PRORP domain-containing protein n=2 Tax=Selaginella moellendorffii TaxID=88036 RepID=D8S319_SELML|nr:hypothetical protein SELMODRAFT_417622 [Selaginella moellendorffii]
MEGVAAERASLLCVLVAVSDAGDLASGCRWFASMELDYGVAPGRIHYCCVVDLISRAGRLDEAEEVALGMPVEERGESPDWCLCLLGAAGSHNDARAGARVARAALEMDPGSSQSFVLLEKLCGLSM